MKTKIKSILRVIILSLLHVFNLKDYNIILIFNFFLDYFKNFNINLVDKNLNFFILFKYIKKILENWKIK